MQYMLTEITIKALRSSNKSMALLSPEAEHSLLAMILLRCKTIFSSRLFTPIIDDVQYMAYTAWDPSHSHGNIQHSTVHD